MTVAELLRDCEIYFPPSSSGEYCGTMGWLPLLLVLLRVKIQMQPK